MEEFMKMVLASKSKDARIDNYIVPGLSSTLLGWLKPRVFEASRAQEVRITPHNHRYNLFSMVLQGWVKNTVYVEDELGDRFAMVSLEAEDFRYKEGSVLPRRFTREARGYTAGEYYYMDADVFHTIEFSRDAVVLILEGHQFKKTSQILLPAEADGQVLNTFRVEDWMFRRPTIVDLEES